MKPQTFDVLQQVLVARAVALTMVLAAILGLAGPAQATTIPEPGTVFYGQVYCYDHGYEVPLTSGTLDWKIQPNSNDARTYQLDYTLDPITNGAAIYAYRLKVPHEALASGLALGDLSPETIPLTGNATAYRHVAITYNGAPARILPPAAPIFNAAQASRLTAYRLDLEVVMVLPDTDGNGLPDWWQLKFFGHLGTNAGADPDHDGLTNLQEYKLGTNPNSPNTAPTVVWENAEIDQGATELVGLQAVDANTSPSNLVYTVTQAPAGAHLSLLFGATVPSTNGLYGDKLLHNGDTFTQAQVNAGQLALTHDNPLTNEVSFSLSLSDGSTNVLATPAAFTLAVHSPTATDGSDATVWLSSRFATNRTLSSWSDLSGAKAWRNGASTTFDAQAVPAAITVTNLGPLGQPVLALNQPGQPVPQSLALPATVDATVFAPGEITVFAVVKATGTNNASQQIVTGPNFQLGLTGPVDQGRDQQVRFASENIGTVYGNHKIGNQWLLLSAWQDQSQLTLEVNGRQAGGPQPLDVFTALGTDPGIGARRLADQVDQNFQGLLGEVLVFNRNLGDAERRRINFSLLSKWFGWVLLDGSDEPRDLTYAVPSSGLSAGAYRTNFVPRFGPDHHYILVGGNGHDVLVGGQNDDIIVGGHQADVMTGGGGKDTFVFNYDDIDHETDTITDFNPTTDQDSLDVADLLRGASTDLRDYLRLRTDGHNSWLDLDFKGADKYTNHTILLQSVVLRNADLPALWANGNLLSGNKGIPLTASVATTVPLATEITGNPATFNLHFAGTNVPSGLEVPFVLGGSAVRGADYTLNVQQFNPATGLYQWAPVTNQQLCVSLKPGDFDLAVQVQPIENYHSQPDRTVQLQLTAVPEWYSVSGSPAIAQITDGPQSVSVVASIPTANNAGTAGAFTLTRAGSIDIPLTVTVQLTGSAPNGVDYAYIPTVVQFATGQSNVVVAVQPFTYATLLATETAEMVLQPGAGYVVNPLAQAASVVLQNSGPIVTAQAIEPLAVVADGSTGAFLLQRQGALQQSLTVLFTLSGTALPGLDYRRISGFVTFGVGASTALITVTPLVSAVISNGAKTVDLRLTPNSSYTLGSTNPAEVRLVSSYLTFAQWKTANFPANSTDPLVFANQDYNHNGISNAVSYAFGLNPKTTNYAGLPHPVLLNGRFGVGFNRPIAAVDVYYLIEVSADLRNWVNANATFDEQPGSLLTNGLESVVFLDEQAVPATSQRYIRVRPSLQ